MFGIVYIFAITFQFVGAVILASKYVPVNMDVMIQKLDLKRFVLQDETLIIPELTPSNEEYAEMIYLNRLAFGYIAIGYFGGIIGESQYSKLVNCIVIMGLSTILIIFTNIVASKMANKRFGNK